MWDYLAYEKLYLAELGKTCFVLNLNFKLNSFFAVKLITNVLL